MNRIISKVFAPGPLAIGILLGLVAPSAHAQVTTRPTPSNYYYYSAPSAVSPSPGYYYYYRARANAGRPAGYYYYPAPGIVSPPARNYYYTPPNPGQVRGMPALPRGAGSGYEEDTYAYKS